MAQFPSSSVKSRNFPLKAKSRIQFAQVTFCQYFYWEHVIIGDRRVEQTLHLWVHKEAAQHPTLCWNQLCGRESSSHSSSASPAATQRQVRRVKMSDSSRSKVQVQLYLYPSVYRHANSSVRLYFERNGNVNMLTKTKLTCWHTAGPTVIWAFSRIKKPEWNFKKCSKITLKSVSCCLSCKGCCVDKKQTQWVKKWWCWWIMWLKRHSSKLQGPNV